MLKKTDRTKRLYCDALLSLCEEKELSRITIGDLAEVTGTSRQTFYNNFRDINDLISYIPINYLKTAEIDTLSTENARRAYQYAFDHRGFFAQLPDHVGQNNFRDTFIPWLADAFYNIHITSDLDGDERLYRKFCLDIFVIGITNQFLDWCSSNFSWPLDILLRAQEEALPDFAKPEEERSDLNAQSCKDQILWL